MPEAVRIRRIGAEDAPLLRQMRLRSLTDAPEAFGQTATEAGARPDEEWRQQVRAASSGDRRAWFFAEVDGKAPRVAGLVNGRRRPPDTLMVFSMWVEPESRRLGIGRRLIDALQGWARTWGGTRCVLWVFAGNEPAIRFYERLGFRIEPEGPDADTGRSYGALAMSKPIGEAG